MGIITTALLFIGPAYVANAAPLVFGGGARLDRDWKFFDGKPLFGSHKTVRGLFAGIIGGGLVGLGESLIDNRLALAGLMIAVGAVMGDLLGAFIKRRLRIQPGRSFLFLDQLDFVLGGLAIGALFLAMPLVSTLIVILVTPPIHLATNYGAYLLGIKKGRW